VIRAILVAVGLLIVSNVSNACQPFGDIGKTTPSGGSQPYGIAGLGCRFEDKYDVTLQWVGEAELYDGQLREAGFPLLTVSRVFQPFEHKLFGGTPEFYWGVGIKGADRCAYNGELSCNRRLPLPLNAHFGLGLHWNAMSLKLLHDSNNAMDHGEEKKNLGVTWLTLAYWIGT
jgi:hypothetical protein